MQARRVHVLKVPTNDKNIFPYSHYNDVGNPKLSTHLVGN